MPRLLLILFIIFELLNMSSAHASTSVIIPINSLQESNEYLKDIDRNALVLVDIDDTVITPKDKIFRYDNGNNKHQNFIDDYKAASKKDPSPESLAKFKQTLGNWRLQRKVMLVEPEWPTFITDLKTQGNLVISLTKMDIGSFGPIKDMAKWRINELESLNIHFSEHLNDSELACQQGKALFERGILFTGTCLKSDTLQTFVTKFNLTPSKIIFFDDRIEQLEDIAAKAKELNIDFLGFHYQAASLIPGSPDEKVASFQKQYLFEHQKWLSDEEAENLVTNKKM